MPTETDNGKTQEQLAEERKQRYMEHPDYFVEMSEVIAVVKRSPKGIMHYIGKSSRIELILAKNEIQFQVDEILRQLNAAAAPKIIRPKAGREMFGKR